MSNPNLITSNSPTVSPFLKDYTVHIPYTQEKVFKHDEISNHVGDKELISFVGIENEVSKRNIEDTKNPKRPNVSPSLVEYIPKIPYSQALKREISDLNPGNGEGGCLEARSLSSMDIIPPRLADVMEFLIPKSKGRSVISVVSRLLLAATSYYLWCERNSRLFKKKSSKVPQIIEVVTAIVRLKLVTFKFKKVSSRARILLDTWKILSSSIISEGSSRKFFKEVASSGPSAFLVLLLDGEEFASFTGFILLVYADLAL
ncbi:hypothetical protein Tco_0499375 [Tanacetum coccineum]